MHTKGEWKIEYAQTGVRWPVIYVDDETWDGGHREIAELSDHVARRCKDDTWRKVKGAAEAEANARLMRSAPDMLAALEEARAALYGAREVLGNIANIGHAIALANAAIRKAAPPESR